MERQRKDSLLTRRQALLVGAGLLLAVGGTHLIDRTIYEQANLTPLKPESGNATDKLNVSWLPATVTRWRPLIEKYGNAYDTDPNLLAIMMTVESGGNPTASSGEADGLMQIAPGTAKDIASRYLHTPRKSYDLKDPATSIEFGAAYIHHLVKQFGDADQGPDWDKTVQLVAAGYNGGPEVAKDLQKRGLSALETYKDKQTYVYTRYVHVMWQERNDNRSFAYHNWLTESHGQNLIDKAAKEPGPH